MATVKSYLSALKWAGAKEFLFDLAVSNHLQFKVLDHDKGLLRETIYYEVEGKESDLKRFKQRHDKALAEHDNSDS